MSTVKLQTALLAPRRRRPPKVSVIVTTFQRPGSLSKVLASLACQDYPESYEVIVADDGSTDRTQAVVNRHAAAASFHVGFVSHQHQAFELARCRNEGMRAAKGRYLIFLDGDCVAPPNFLTKHMQLRQVGKVVAGYTCHLDQHASTWLDENVIAKGDHSSWTNRDAHRQLAKLDRKANFYRLIRHHSKPRLRGGNFGVWRSDFQRVNGFDESFVGWGCEDDDFGMRLRRAGVVIQNAFEAIPTFHLWHPVETSAPTKWRDGPNAVYLHRKIRWTRCLNGLEKRDLSSLRVRLTGSVASRQWLSSILAPTRLLPPGSFCNPKHDVEVVVGPTERFRTNADCKILILPDPVKRKLAAAKKADVIVTDDPRSMPRNKLKIQLSGIQNFLESITSRRLHQSNRREAA